MAARSSSIFSGTGGGTGVKGTPSGFAPVDGGNRVCEAGRRRLPDEQVFSLHMRYMEDRSGGQQIEPPLQWGLLPDRRYVTFGQIAHSSFTTFMLCNLDESVFTEEAKLLNDLERNFDGLSSIVKGNLWISQWQAVKGKSSGGMVLITNAGPGAGVLMQTTQQLEAAFKHRDNIPNKFYLDWLREAHSRLTTGR